MRTFGAAFRLGVIVQVAWLLSLSLGAETVRVATYNVENYLVMNRMVEGRWSWAYPKPEKSKTALRGVITSVRPDVLALQEMGTASFLAELQRDLKRDGLDYPFAYLLEADDEVRHVAILSRFPFQEVRAHTDMDFPYLGERSRIRRGLLEVVFSNGGETWSLFVVHLKSKWTEIQDDPQAARKRTGEATAARNRILELHDPDAGGAYLIVGDFNDTRDTSPLRRFLRRGAISISSIIPAADSRGYTWTHHWERQQVFSRVDFLLASPAMLETVVDGKGYIYDGPGYGLASDHRLVWADFAFGATSAVSAETAPPASGGVRR
jgi:endonuclease/exonuclease/phosphatase family metal-dependent hydrolase